MNAAELRTVVDTIIDGVITIDTQSIVCDCNPATLRLFGYDYDEIVGHNVSMLMPEPYRSQHDGYIRRYLESGQARVIGFGREVVGQRKDGSTFPMELSVGEASGEQRRFVGIVRDVTRRRLYQERLREARREAQQANRAKSTFLANMSHELRTPLNSVIGFSGILLGGMAGAINDEQRRQLEFIQSSGQHLLELINNILDLSKVESGRMVLAVEPFELQALIRGAVASVQPQAEAKSLSVRMDLPKTPITIVQDAGRLKQVLLNLLSNAIKFTHRGEIRVEADQEHGRITCRVRDSGIGMSAADLERVFEPFVKVATEHSVEQPGTGLGLALCRSFAELMGGAISAESTPGQGSCFTLSLPSYAPTQHATPPALRGGHDKRNQSGQRDADVPVILIIDDDAQARELKRIHLEQAGYQVLQLDSGRHAVETIRAQRPDLVLLDLIMPEVNGWEVLAQIKQDPEIRETPVMCISILDGCERTLRMGAVGFMVKPIDPNDLKEKVAALLHDDTSHRRALVIDDDPVARALICKVLQSSSMGFSCVEAGSGREALHHVESSEPPDLIVTDMMMPQMDGLELITQLRTREGFQEIPILMVTAKELDEVELTALANHRVSVEKKSALEPQQLVAQLRDALKDKEH